VRVRNQPKIRIKSKEGIPKEGKTNLPHSFRELLIFLFFASLLPSYVNLILIYLEGGFQNKMPNLTLLHFFSFACFPVLLLLIALLLLPPSLLNSVNQLIISHISNHLSITHARRRKKTSNNYLKQN